MIEWIIIGAFLLITVIRTKKRGYFWRAKDGRKLKLKEFLQQWKKGVEGVTPLQQTLTTLWSYPLIIAGILWGIVVSLISSQYWLTLILSGSLPITLISILNTWQKYKQQLKIKNEFEKAKKEL